VTGADARAVALRGLGIVRRGRAVLHDVSLEVAPGSFIAVLGPNGAGKSTLMQALLGLLPISGGAIEVLGATPELARARIGYLPQRRSFDRSTRIRGTDLVRLGIDGTRWGLPVAVTRGGRARHHADRARVAATIDMVGATDYARRPIGELSGGEQQRLLIAQALVSEPDMLILDEPLDSLDLPNQVSVAALIGSICATQGVTVLLVAHDVNPLLGYLDGVIYLAGGTGVSGTVDEVITTPRLSALYGAPIEVLRTADGRLVVVGQPEAPHVHGHRHEH
jgi:zinc/manganese transport system ATP-binding protein